MQQTEGAPRPHSVRLWVWLARVVVYLGFLGLVWVRGGFPTDTFGLGAFLVVGLLPAWWIGGMVRMALTEGRNLVLSLPAIVGGYGLIWVPEYRYLTALGLALYLAWLQVATEKRSA